jgi:hypothetical protein
MTMKMYIWVDPYRVSYESSLCFAVAETVEQARQIAMKSPLYRYGTHAAKSPSVALGEPDRVLDLPCAEWFEWEA